MDICLVLSLCEMIGSPNELKLAYFKIGQNQMIFAGLAFPIHGIVMKESKTVCTLPVRGEFIPLRTPTEPSCHC